MSTVRREDPTVTMPASTGTDPSHDDTDRCGPAPEMWVRRVLALAGRPGDQDDEEMRAWTDQVRRAADDLWHEAFHAAAALRGRPATPPALTLDPDQHVAHSLNIGRLSGAATARLCERIADQVRGDVMPDLVIGMSRYGMPVAAILARMLNVPRVATVDVGYADDRSTALRLYSQPLLIEPCRRLLLVSDYVRTGRRLAYAADVLANGTREVRTAVLCRHPHSPPVPYVGAVVDHVPTMPWGAPDA